MNQIVVALTSSETELGVRLQHHAYDLGQMTALGVVSFAVVVGAHWVLVKARVRGSPSLWHALGLGTAVFVVSLLIVGPDVSNAALRHGFPRWLATGGAALAFGATFGVIALLRVLRSSLARVAIGVTLALPIAVSNAFILMGDYPAIHFMLAWMAASLFALAAEGAVPSPPMSRRTSSVLLGLVAASSFASIFVPPSQQVLVRLYGVSSSILTPYLAKFYPKAHGYDLEGVRSEALRSPWFQDRNSAPAIPASGRVHVPEPRVVLIVVDTLRYDVVTKQKYLRRLPAFKKLHESSARFVNARAAATWTRGSIGALMSGRPVSQLKWGSANGKPILVDPTPRWAELLTRAGVSTTMIPFFSIIDAQSGIGKGFGTEIPGRNDAGTVISKVIDLLQESRGRSFIYAHIAEPHAPYRGKGSRFERYVQDVELVDTALLKLLEFLQSSKLANNTIVVITADHGEAFGEHGTYFHARHVYEELAHIPLFVLGPKIAPREITTPAALIDVGPTILDFFGVPTPGVYMGQSLAPLIAGEAATLERPITVHIGSTQGMYFPDHLKVIFAPSRATTEVYDLRSDPGERQNLIDSKRADVRSAIETARMFFHVHRAQDDTAEGSADEAVERE